MEPDYEHLPEETKILIRGLKKLEEELISQEELSHVRKLKGYLVVDHIEGKRSGAYATLKESEYRSSAAPKMNQKEILALLKKSKVI